MAKNCQWLLLISFPKFGMVVVKLQTIDLKEHPKLSHFTSRQKIFNIESGSVNEACKKKRVVYRTGLDCSLIYT